MAETHFFGQYARFDTPSQKEGSQLISTENLIGDRYEIVFVTDGGKRVAWLKNRNDNLVGFFDERVSRELALCEARQLIMWGFLSFVAFTDSPKPGRYWGEAALVCFSPQEASLKTFALNVEKQISAGRRPNIDLGTQGIKQVIDSNGAWFPSKSVPLPKLEEATAFVKTKRSLTEKLVEKGRSGNKGCSVASWVFLFVLVVGLFFALRACGVF